jgi:hypothetical protein
MPSSSQISVPILTRRRLGLAGIFAFLGCAACCTVPLLAAAGLGSGGIAALSYVFRPGNELVVGGSLFVLAIGAMAIGARLRKREASGCTSTCKLDGSCCARGAATRNA